MSEYVEFLTGHLARLGPVEPRRMFGGFGIFHQGLMFALVVDDTLYLKADAELAPTFEARGLPPFCYARGGRLVALSFFQAPAELYDDPEEAERWARASCAAALRAVKRGVSGKPRRPK